MIDLDEGAIKHLPEKRISREDSFWLGYADNFDYWLVVEEWEFRVYNYEWRAEESIMINHEWEDWWAYCSDYIQSVADCLDKDTMEYTVPKFETNDAEDMAIDLVRACEERFEDVSYNLKNGDWTPSELFIKFIRHWLEKINSYNKDKVYCYYK